MKKLLTINNIFRRCGVAVKSTILAIGFAAVAHGQMANAQDAEEEQSLTTEDDDEEVLNSTSEDGDALPEGKCGGTKDNSLAEGSCGGAKIEKSLMTEDDDEEVRDDELPDAEALAESEPPDISND